MVDNGIVKVPIKNGEVDIPSFLEAKRQAVMIASDDEEVRRLFNIEQEKKDFADAMVAAARARNDTSITQEVASEATERVYDGFFVFQEPPATLRTRLMDLYLNRARFIYMPIIVAGLTTAIAVGSAGTIKYAKHKAHEASLTRQEKTVERTIDDLFQTRTTLGNQIKEISDYITEKKPSDSADLGMIVTSAKGQLEKTDALFTDYRPTESAVTRDNYTGASKDATTVESILSQVSRQVRKGEDMIALNDGLIAVAQSLDSLIGEVKSTKPVDVLMDRANTIYQSGISAVEHRQLKEAQNYRTQLAEIKTSAHQFATMPAQLDKAYQAVVNIVEHQPTKQWADKAYYDGRTYVQGVDIPNLRQTIQELSDKAAILAQEYEIFIIRQPNVRTVWDIGWYQTERGKETITRVDFFARCQARRNGRTIPLTFYDVGQDKTVTTETFGYRISGDELGGVPDDAMMEEFRDFVGSGRYQKIPLAIKARGYPEEEIKYNSPSARRVLPFSDKTSMVPDD